MGLPTVRGLGRQRRKGGHTGSKHGESKGVEGVAAGVCNVFLEQVGVCWEDRAPRAGRGFCPEPENQRRLFTCAACRGGQSGGCMEQRLVSRATAPGRGTHLAGRMRGEAFLEGLASPSDLLERAGGERGEGSGKLLRGLGYHPHREGRSGFAGKVQVVTLVWGTAWAAPRGAGGSAWLADGQSVAQCQPAKVSVSGAPKEGWGHRAAGRG